MAYTVVLNSKNRGNPTQNPNDAIHNFDWGALEEGEYRVTWSIYRTPVITLARFFRWDITGARGWGGGFIQVAELPFLNNGTRVSYVGATATDYTGTAIGIPMNAINQNVNDKWYVGGPQAGNATYLLVTFPAGIMMNQYQICTANDVDQRDPIYWVLSSSVDGINYTAINTQVNYATPVARFTYSELIPIA